jgi:hypothetical protein
MFCGSRGSLGFVFTAPLIVAFLFAVNVMSWSGEWWVQWPALGIGLAWVINLFSVIRSVAIVGGLAAIAAYLAGRR